MTGENWDRMICGGAVEAAPPGGWRRVVHRLSRGRVNPGESSRQAAERGLLDRIRTPLRGDHRIAVMSLKGGVGKTTTTVTLGGVFASLRGDRVVAVDANPDLGTLARRVGEPPDAPTVRDLLAVPDFSRYPQVKACASQSSSRLEVIGSDRDPAVSEAFSEDDYRRAVDILQHHYNIILTDCGTGLLHSAMAGVLDLAHTLVLVTSPALDGVQSAEATLDWLEAHGRGALAANAVVVVSGARPGQAAVDPAVLVSHFGSRTRAVCPVPFDRHLSEGAVVDLARLRPATLLAYRELAATVAEDFTSWHRHAAV
ncbi:MinD/ParA family ATP-binding protein [Corynebacterium provencense]|uniref:MinD/ParA family ATP-binding protein n=1 Tax=Corynebacterium provencense TaxID=1737425 RepID=UPI000A633337|nr:MinD/ParA family protein [Corynebacterium provencense]